MHPLGIGIIGVGGMGSFHARTLAAFHDVQVVAVSDPYRPNAIAVRDEVGATIFDDPSELIRSGSLDALVIASPDETHASLATDAIAAGLPTLCEKPLASTVTDARRVVDAEIATGQRSIQVGFMREYDPAHRQVQAELVSLGEIDYVRAIHRNANTRRRPLDRIVVQSMIHDVHSVHFLTGAAITAVHASGSGAEAGSFRHVVVLCTLDSGAHAVIEFDDGGFGYEVGVEILTRTGDVVTGSPMRAIRRHAGSISSHLGADWFGWFADAYRVQDAAWIQSIRTRTPAGPSAWDGFTSQLVVGAITESLATGTTVDVAEVERPPLYA